MTIFFDSQSKQVSKPDGIKATWRLGAYALVRSKDNKILMIKGTDHGLWELPGGRVDIGEVIRDAAVRETYEETGYKIIASAKMPLYVGEGGWYKTRTKEFFQTVYFIVEATLSNEAPDTHVVNKIGNVETEEVRWVTPKELTEKNCHQNFYPFL